MGEGLAAFAGRVVIATKFGFRIGTTGQQSGVDSRSAHIRAVADASLRRLRVETIDLFYQHRVDPDVPIEDFAPEALAANQALVAAIGRIATRKQATPAQREIDEAASAVTVQGACYPEALARLTGR